MRAESAKNGFILLDLVSALGLLISIVMVMSVAFQTLITYKVNTTHMLEAVTVLRSAIDEWQHTGKLPAQRDMSIYNVTCNAVTMQNIEHEVAEFVVTYYDASGNCKTYTLIASSGINHMQVLHE